MSSVTMSGSSAWICRSASSPSRAVPTTRNSSEAVATTSLMTRRMNALSSTTSTVRTRGRGATAVMGATGVGLEDMLPAIERSHHQSAVPHMQEYATPVIPAGILGRNANSRRHQRAPDRVHVSLAHVDAARWQQRPEHARATRQLRGERPGRPELPHLLEQERDRGAGKLCAVAPVPGHALAWQQDVREPSDGRAPVVDRDRDARPEAERRDHRIAARHRVGGHVDPDLLDHWLDDPAAAPRATRGGRHVHPGSNTAEDPLARIDRREEIAGGPEQRLDFTEDEKPARHER